MCLCVCLKIIINCVCVCVCVCVFVCVFLSVCVINLNVIESLRSRKTFVENVLVGND